MNIKPIAQISAGQDGAIWGQYIFRFDTAGHCRVHALGSWEYVGEFTLDRADKLTPHSNAVVFGCEYYAPEDEFPLLYTNIYNNYAKADDPLKGVCCVYRLLREGSTFTSQLVQLIAIGFTEDTGLWCSPEGDVRPYGNFVIDREHNRYYAFVMRDGCHSTRYFSFSLPSVVEGEMDETFHVRRCTLAANGITDFFDVPYHHYIQGACFHQGNIYSVEGFTDDKQNPPGIRVIDPAARCQTLYVNFMDMGIREEAEFIDFADGICYYSDAHGKLYTLEF